ncbi:MAG: FtsQ-type POTRA domain-containing protein [Oscillospiraceae bacterium]|nr:FtsQ-type POTRA domain-containing protein [Oscillospiraceae bacterium]
MKLSKIISKIKNFFLAAFVIVCVTAAFLFLTNKYFFKVKSVNIAENDRYSYEQILEASEISMGEELYGLDVKKTESNIKEKLTYAKAVDIRRVPPSTVNIEVKTEAGLFGIMISGDYYIISESFRVVDKIKAGSRSEFEPLPAVITIKTAEVKKCYLGDKIEFLDLDIYDFLREMVGFIADGDTDPKMVSEILEIDITNKFKVTMNYGNRFFIKFGIFENISPKILNVFEIISQLPDYYEGVIDISDAKTASFVYKENVFK